jgi:hypothetical protein
MIWLTWRQFRAQSWGTAAVLAAIAVALAVTGAGLAHLAGTTGLNACAVHHDCGSVAATFMSQLKASTADKALYYAGLVVLYLLPVLVGMFWGAPLLTREIETGTFRVAWTQSVTRIRWLAVKLGLIGLTAVATAGLLSLMIGWWASPVDHALGLATDRNGASGFPRLAPLLFGARGVVPIGYAAFGFALGVAAGIVIRRTIPAMAASGAVIAGALVAMPLWVRAHLIAPLHAATAITATNIDGMSISGNGGQANVTAAVNIPGAWILTVHPIKTNGQVFTGPAPQSCLSNTTSFNACSAAVGRLHLRQVVTYQPASRFWTFQWYETGIFLLLAVSLTGFCFWWIRRRRLA